MTYAQNRLKDFETKLLVTKGEMMAVGINWGLGLA